VPYRVFAHDTINGLPAHAFTQSVSGHGPVLGVVQNAFHNWTCFSAADCRVPGTSWTSTFSGTFTSPVGNSAVNGMDGKNNVLWEGGTDWRYSALTLGLTTTSFYPSTGQIIDADMELNNNVVWDDQGAANAYDYESVVLHEAGHFLGLNHTASQVAVMYATVPMGATGIKRTLAQPDITDVTTLYPSGQTTGVQGAPCTTANDCGAGLGCLASSGSSAAICTVDCTGGAACPAPLTCQAANTGKGCFAPPSASDYCSFCTDGSQCLSGICLSDGAGHNWCTSSCTPGAACGTNSTCLDVATAAACATGSGSCVCAPNGLKCPNQCSGSCPTPGFTCNAGTCEASGNLGDRCETSGICHSCLMCIGNTTAAYCMTCCGGSTSDCLNCPQVTCPTGFACQGVTGTNDSVCVATTGATTCAACGTGSPCLNGETCVGGACHPSCNPQAPGTCPACAAESATTGLCVCVDTEIHGEGDSCGVGQTVAACISGLTCAGGKCARPCVVGDASSCPSGQTCMSVNGVPACVNGSAGALCDMCNGQTCNNGNICFNGRCYKQCNVLVKNGPCDSSCVDVGGGQNVCACDDQIGGVGHPCGGSPIGACSTGLLCIAGSCEGQCDPMGMNTCPLLTTCQELVSKPGTFVCQPADQGSGGGGGTFASGGGGGGGTSGKGGGAGGGTGDSGCGCGSAPAGLLLVAVAGVLRRRRRSQSTPR
jgi:hypothetical protein